jgi:dipeptidase E
LLYIPIAIDTSRHQYPECLKYVQDKFKPFNISNIIMLTDLASITREEIDKIGGVYIGGGNTPKLLKEIKESGFIEHLRYLAKKDIPLAGGSAGAIIFAKTITSSLKVDSNQVGLKDFAALDMTRGYELWCHYDKSWDKTIKEFQTKYKLTKVVGLPEDCGLYVENSKIQIVGPGSAILFTDKRVKYKPGTLLP